VKKVLYRRQKIADFGIKLLHEWFKRST